MYTLRACRIGALSIVCICWLSILTAAQDAITDPQEVRALRAVKNSLVDPFHYLDNWNRGDPCTSNWTGVLCFNRTLADGYLHVWELQLLNRNLSGYLSPEIGRLSRLRILDFMWNKISGTIPKEIANITSLELLLLNGNQLTGILPQELGYLQNLERIQIDQNQISGPIPKSFANLNKAQHFHMNNNSISGQIPPELSRLPSLVHFLLDNNNLTGYLPPEFSEMPNLNILQLDNNNFDGTTIPPSYGSMFKLLKLSLRNCSLQGEIPDLSKIANLSYIDLSLNNLNGSIPPGRLYVNITTIILSNNSLTGSVPTTFSNLPELQRLSLANNLLNGSIQSSIWQNRTLNSTESFIIDLENNRLTSISDSSNPPANVTVWLGGNPLCSNSTSAQFCRFKSGDEYRMYQSTNTNETCHPFSCPPPYEYSLESPQTCFCAAPLLVGYRLKSPGFSDFPPYEKHFVWYLTNGLNVHLYQLHIDSLQWERGPRLKMYLKLFPVFGSNDNNSYIFNKSEVRRIRRMFTAWTIPDNDNFGPYELLNFTLSEVYKDVFPTSTSSTSKGKLVGIVLGAIAGAVTLSAIVSLLILRIRFKGYHVISKKRKSYKSSIHIEGVKSFTYAELTLATNNFSSSTQVGEGGYGKVYKGMLADGMLVAIKRAQVGSLQGEKEFLTEIELLSRLHHRNLVSLIGYCDEEGEQMLVYEYMCNGTLRDNLSGKSKEIPNFAMRLRFALGSAKGILYLHTEADPPIFHRDIKASNILLDSKFTAKVADFGLSRLAPVADIEGDVPGHISTVVKGTPGYLDPEYFLTHKLTDKSDVYSLGIVFLELLTGMRPISHGKNIVREVTSAYESGEISSIVDAKMGSYPSECVEKFATLAFKCCKNDTEARPSMAEVTRELEDIWNMMPESDIRTNMSECGSKQTETPSSSSMTRTYTSMDVSGSDLASDVVPSITPR